MNKKITIYTIEFNTSYGKKDYNKDYDLFSQYYPDNEWKPFRDKTIGTFIQIMSNCNEITNANYSIDTILLKPYNLNRYKNIVEIDSTNKNRVIVIIDIFALRQDNFIHIANLFDRGDILGIILPIDTNYNRIVNKIIKDNKEHLFTALNAHKNQKTAIKNKIFESSNDKMFEETLLELVKQATSSKIKDSNGIPQSIKDSIQLQ